jgi:hypothetical protein
VIDQIEARFEQLIASGRPFTADDVTDGGRLALDDEHAANGRQSAIGTLFSKASKAGRIVPTGAVRSSSSPRRKGGLIREWQGVDGQLRFDW